MHPFGLFLYLMFLVLGVMFWKRGRAGISTSSSVTTSTSTTTFTE